MTSTESPGPPEATMDAADHESDRPSQAISNTSAKRDETQALSSQTTVHWHQDHNTITRADFLRRIIHDIDTQRVIPPDGQRLFMLFALEKEVTITSLPNWMHCEFDPESRSFLLTSLLGIVESLAWEFLSKNCRDILRAWGWYDPVQLDVSDFIKTVLKKPLDGERREMASSKGLEPLRGQSSYWQNDYGELLGLRNAVAHHRFEDYDKTLKYAASAAKFARKVSRSGTENLVVSVISKITDSKSILKKDASMLNKLYHYAVGMLKECGHEDLTELNKFFEIQWNCVVYERSRAMDSVIRKALDPIINEKPEAAVFTSSSQHLYYRASRTDVIAATEKTE